MSIMLEDLVYNTITSRDDNNEDVLRAYNVCNEERSKHFFAMADVDDEFGNEEPSYILKKCNSGFDYNDDVFWYDEDDECYYSCTYEDWYNDHIDLWQLARDIANTEGRYLFYEDIRDLLNLYDDAKKEASNYNGKVYAVKDFKGLVRLDLDRTNFIITYGDIERLADDLCMEIDEIMEMVDEVEE